MGLDDFFSPKSIVLVGASNKRGKVGFSLVQHLCRFKGKVFYVNKKGYEINGKKCYKSLSDVKEKIDLVIIAVPAQAVPAVMLDCARQEIKNIIIISAGFSEVGRKDLEQEILSIAKKAGIGILGPNCFGIVNTATNINLDTTFARQFPLKGNVGFISQSGALWSAIAEISHEQKIGFSKFISLGDMLDLDFSDFLEYLNNDDQTKIIVCYIETLKDGRRFMDNIKKCKKPVIIVKGGRSEAGAKATYSHTGSLAGKYTIYKAALKQAGAVLVFTIEEALDTAKLLSMQDTPKGRRVLVITNAGGPGILCADYLEENGLHVVPLPKDLFSTKELNELPYSWSHNNPIDLLGDAQTDRFHVVLTALAKHKFYDAVIVLLTPQEMTPAYEIAKEIIIFYRKIKIPTVACLMGHESFVESRKILEGNSIPCFSRPERIAKLLANLVQ